MLHTKLQALFGFTVLQAFGMLELKKPCVYSSKLHTWRAQAVAECLGVNYIVFRIMLEQPIGGGIPVLLTSFENKQASNSLLWATRP